MKQKFPVMFRFDFDQLFWKNESYEEMFHHRNQKIENYKYHIVLYT